MFSLPETDYLMVESLVNVFISYLLFIIILGSSFSCNCMRIYD